MAERPHERLSEAFLGGYLAGLAGKLDDDFILEAAYRIDPERNEYHAMVAKLMRGANDDGATTGNGPA